jgi:hypothetical protein
MVCTDCIPHLLKFNWNIVLSHGCKSLKNDHDVNIKAANMYEHKSWNIQEVHDVEAFERGAANAASVRRQARSPFPLKLQSHPGYVSRSSQTVVVPLPPTVPENTVIPRMDRELESFRNLNRQGMSVQFTVQGTIF